MSLRENLNVVFVGHVDHGKSTLIGRLLYDTKALPDGAIEKVKKISEEEGKKFEYAFLLDAFEEEQRQGITIDITMIQFFTKRRDYVIIDAPGHKEFLKNMISGAASAEAAILVVDAKEGIQEQSKRHGYILSLLGIKKVYVAVNKMDLVDYSEERYNEIVTQFNEFLGNLNIHPESYIPISAFLGENVAKKSEKMSWYKGKSILDTMDGIEKDKGIEKKPLRFPIQDIYKFDNRRIIAGRIESGSLKKGDEVVFYPSLKTTKVKSVEFWQDKDKTDEVSAKMSVGITVEDEFYNKRGEIICHKDSGITVSNSFNANVFWMGKEPFLKGKKYKLKIATQEIEIEIEKIKKVIDAATLQEITGADHINKNDVAEIVIKSQQPICFDAFGDNEALGRFVIIDEFNTSGGGIILGSAEVSKKERETKRLVTKEDRKNKFKELGKLIAINGDNKETNISFAIKLEKKLFDLGQKVYYLDSKEYEKIADILRENGITVIVANREKLSEAVEIIVDEAGKISDNILNII
ncbi:sulfate adenylyltransferase subunit 1 [Clostridium felsineum]|uniref:sulfate adenylyltransferase n=1 Tax=Clostridium felsineum TaxID=36839 RepID=A0A1S8L3T3_9CLOT|nr:GTP-binding protein [Clostridium felsineum]URZ08999.1 Bifunctional enzyme CysN/CysC [Clostridium felsineum]URZ09627.1 Bifunctional enzyme CysN/CysC [Clostridium felsineum]